MSQRSSTSHTCECGAIYQRHHHATVRCSDCSAKIKREAQRRHDRVQYARKKARGICVRCRKKSDTVRCPTCIPTDRVINNTRRWDIDKMGLRLAFKRANGIGVAEQIREKIDYDIVLPGDSAQDRMVEKWLKSQGMSSLYE